MYIYASIYIYILIHTHTNTYTHHVQVLIIFLTSHQARWDVRFPPKDIPEPDPEMNINPVKLFRTLEV